MAKMYAAALAPHGAPAALPAAMWVALLLGRYDVLALVLQWALNWTIQERGGL